MCGFGVLGDIIVGLIGAFIGGIIVGLLWTGSVGWIGSIVVAFIGACILIANSPAPASERDALSGIDMSAAKKKKQQRYIEREAAPSVAARRGWFDPSLGPDGKPALHPHVVVSRADGIAMGGHLLEAHVRPTLEVVLTESPRHLRKRKDPESGLALIAADD